MPLTRTQTGVRGLAPVVGLRGPRRKPNPPNLLRWSEAFDNAVWAKGNLTVAADSIVAPNGSTTADRLAETTAVGSHAASQAVAVPIGSVATFSCYAQAAERGIAYLTVVDGSSFRAWFNLATGALGTVNAGLTAAISAAGNGWYRCSVTRTTATNATPTFVLGPTTADGGTGYTGDATKGLNLWGAQVNVGSLAPYQRTQ